MQWRCDKNFSTLSLSLCLSCSPSLCHDIYWIRHYLAAIFCCCIRMNHRVWCAQLSDYHLVCVQCFRLTAWSCSVTCASLSSSPVGKCNLNYSNAFHAPLIANGRFYVCKIGPKKMMHLFYLHNEEKSARLLFVRCSLVLFIYVFICAVFRVRARSYSVIRSSHYLL